ncbi:ATP-binding protein [Salsipaludibacter albus]|uniref:ATP-binding protein n=1 Tax=Salsipaludibacter albus TaxID=2849650 RepID=UPI001EE49630|nr:ATP-binding protein [Salsipaludibacter albus]MBY5163531.1 ATP-binding protein [Salsipaludibacter albus]
MGIRRPDEATVTDHDPSTTVAWSVDGRTFRCRGPLGGSPPLGEYVRIEPPEGEARIGQVLQLDVVDAGDRRLVSAGGDLVDRVHSPASFDGATLARAGDDDLRRTLSTATGGLEVGSLRDRDDVAASLVASGFNRHTFLCGQSGSGKTYSLGVLLERLMLETTLPLLVLDPNGDHVHLGEVAPGVDDDLAARYRAAAADVLVLSSQPDSDHEPLQIRLAELGRQGMAAMLELDPVTDRHEYNQLLHLVEEQSHTWHKLTDVVASMRDDADSGSDLALRTENLGLLQMQIWAGSDGTTVHQHWTGRAPRALIADSSGLPERRERLAVAVSVLQGAWARRREREPFLLVVDEAHDVCPAVPRDPLERQAVELFTRIAGEGRKYGIHLLLSTQRPDKLPDNVLSQCDNLLLMRVNSAGDRAALAERFSFAPTGLVDMVGSFGLGEALLAGRVASPPVLARIGTRITPEGGGDVPTDWAHGGPGGVVGDGPGAS